MEFSEEGGFLLVDKPLHWSSFQAVNKIRHLVRHNTGRKMKVGHAGTLDPLASGLLIVCYGRFTKRIFEFQEMAKEYTGTFRLGATTPSCDLETEIDQTFQTEHITDQMMKTTAASFLGETEQVPPLFSARKIDGKRGYHLAREGSKREMGKSIVRIDEFEIENTGKNEVKFRICCSKGTYIRSIARDFGEKLGSGAHLTALRRTAIGDYQVRDALTLTELEDEIRKNEVD